MSSDRWKARVKGGRRALLKVGLLGVAGWIAVGLRNTALSVLLMQAWNVLTARREQTTARVTPVTPGTGQLHLASAPVLVSVSDDTPGDDSGPLFAFGGPPQIA